MKKKNATGIVTIVSVITLALLMFVISSQAEAVQAYYVKLAITNLVFTIVCAGIYLTDVFTKDITRQMNLIIRGLGGILVLLTLLVSFDVISFLGTWNMVMVGGILFVLLVQLQLLHWGQRVPQIVRYSTLLVILSDVFLIFFFIAKWHNFQLDLWINTAALMSVVMTILGLIFLKPAKEETQS